MKVAVLIQSSKLRSSYLKKQVQNNNLGQKTSRLLNDDALNTVLDKANRQALQLAHKIGGDDITCYILGDYDFQLVLEAKALGAYRVVIDQVNSLKSDLTNLIEEIEQKKYDIVLSPSYDADGLPDQVGSRVAAEMDWDYITQVIDAKKENSEVLIQKDDGKRIINYELGPNTLLVASYNIPVDYLNAKKIVEARYYAPVEMTEENKILNVSKDQLMDLLTYQKSQVDTTSGASQHNETSNVQYHQSSAISGSSEEIAGQILKIVAEKREN